MRTRTGPARAASAWLLGSVVSVLAVLGALSRPRLPVAFDRHFPSHAVFCVSVRLFVDGPGADPVGFARVARIDWLRLVAPTWHPGFGARSLPS